MNRLIGWLKKTLSCFFSKPIKPIDESWIDSKLRRLADVKLKSLFAYNGIKHGDFEIDVHFKNVELLLDAILDVSMAIDNSDPLPPWISNDIKKQPITIDEWFVTTDNYTVIVTNLKGVLEEKLLNYKRVLDGLTEPTKRSYYMRVTTEINSDIDTLVDLITHDWEKHETKAF